MCDHQGFHSTSSRYDQYAHELRFVMVCDGCGREVDEVTKVPYEPQFDPAGNLPYLAAA